MLAESLVGTGGIRYSPSPIYWVLVQMTNWEGNESTTANWGGREVKICEGDMMIGEDEREKMWEDEIW